MIRFLSIVVSSIVLAGCMTTPTQVQNENVTRYKAMSLASVKQCIKVTDAELETTIKYSTQSCFVAEHGMLRMKWDDGFIRAWKDKKTGVSQYQIYITDYGNNWQYPYRLNYKFGESIESSDAEKIFSDVDCSQYGCTHREDVGFNIKSEFLADLSNRYDDIRFDDVKFRIEKKNSENHDWTFNPAELVGLYRVVEGIN